MASQALSQIASFRHGRTQSHRRRGWIGTTVVVVLIIAVIVGAALGTNYMMKKDPVEAVGGKTRVVARGSMQVTVIEDGNLESAANIDVKCMVKGGSSILWIVKDGEFVKKDDKIVELDAAAIEDSITQQRNVFEKARATKIQAEQDLEVAKIAVNEYLEGTFKKELQEAEKLITIAKEDMSSAQNQLDHAKTMFRKGYVSKLELDSQTFAVERAKLELDSATTSRDVLVNFSKEKMLKDLNSKVDIADAKLKSEVEAFKLEESKLKRLEAQLANCVILAPQDGMIVYANEQRGRFGGGQGVTIEEGATVREGQSLVKIPDLNQMQVRVAVHESKVKELRRGMPANIMIQGQEQLKGSVTMIGNQPEQTSWFNGNIKEYATIVKIEGEVAELKPGLTAETEILVAEVKDAVILPIACVVEFEGQFFCWVSKDGVPERRSLTLGQVNDAEVEVVSGVTEGEVVFETPSQLEKEYRRTHESEGSQDKKESRFGKGEGDKANAAVEKGKAEDADKKAAASQASKQASSDDKKGDAAKGEGDKGATGGPGAGGAQRRVDVMSFDADKDGKVSREEVTGQPVERFFDFVDTNADGFIDRTEAADARKRAEEMQRSNGGFGGGPPGGGPGN